MSIPFSKLIVAMFSVCSLLTPKLVPMFNVCFFSSYLKPFNVNPVTFVVIGINDIYLYLLFFFSFVFLSINLISLFSFIILASILFSSAYFSMCIFAIVWSILVPIAPIIVIVLLLFFIAISMAASVSVKSFSGISCLMFLFIFLYLSNMLLFIESKSPIM